MLRQCELLGLSRAGFYYEPPGESAENLQLLRLLDEQYTRTPFYGVRRMTAWLRTQGYAINQKRVRRLLRLLGVEALYQKPRLSVATPGHRIYPYLLRGVPIVRVNQVWSTDSTYIRLRQGFVYLVAIIDWFSRYVLASRGLGHARERFLRERVRTCVGVGQASDFQFGSRRAVHQHSFYQAAAGTRHSDQYGWPWSRAG